MARGRYEDLMVGAERVRCYAAGTGPGVVVFHAWWGLNDDVVIFAERLAGQGFSVLAPDLVRGRIASTIEDAEKLATEKSEAHADSVALAAIDRLTGDSPAKLGTVGFSMGAAWAVWSAAKRPDVAATVVYYGSMTGPSLAGTRALVLGHFAETDPYEPEENLAAMETQLRAAGRGVTLHRYPGTGHWFAEPSRDAWRKDEADLAFTRTVSFLRERLGN
jgi:carboxymethylenebutenolidase